MSSVSIGEKEIDLSIYMLLNSTAMLGCLKFWNRQSISTVKVDSRSAEVDCIYVEADHSHVVQNLIESKVLAETQYVEEENVIIE